MRWDDWDKKFSAMLWVYCTTYKRVIGHTPFRLVYGQEVVVPMEYIVPILWITTLTEMADGNAIENRLTQPIQMEEEQFVTGFHQTVEKQR